MTDSLPQVVRVVPDVAAIRKAFDYRVPEAWHRDGRAELVDVGTMVRVELHGRRVGAWVTDVDPEPQTTAPLRPLAKLSGLGPPADLVDLAGWAAHRWLGPVSTMLGTASPPRMVQALPTPRHATPPPMPDVGLVREAFAEPSAVVRIPPAGDRWPFVLGAVSHGNALILVPSLAQARTVTRRLGVLGVEAALAGSDWAKGAAGATVVGGRAGAWAPVGALAAVLVIDEHDEVYQEERAPTWHARDVAVERARRAGVPCVLTSPMPTPESLRAHASLAVSRAQERAGWPLVQVVDPRDDSSARGTLWTDTIVRLLRSDARVACILNRKGRSRLLACKACDALAVCDVCDRAVAQDEEGQFVCSLGHARPVVCGECGGTTFKNLRIGVSRAREELETLLREPVAEVTGADHAGEPPTTRVSVGTEALLHRLDAADAVVFVDFDQELVASRYRAGEQALSLIVRAGRLVGGRGMSGGRVVVQTRQRAHPVVRAAMTADIESWASAEMTRRQLLRYPPYVALAEISGPAAEDFMDRLGQPLGLEIQGPVDGTYRLRAGDHATLADALGAVERPKGRLRIAVDPLRS